MSSDFLPKFRHQLFDWLQLRLASSRLPFRRVEETPPVMTAGGMTAPDLVLWINRDSLLAGAMILIPAKADPALLQNGCAAAGSLGLRQFVTWEARAVNLWETGAPAAQLLNSWPMPGAHAVSTDDFAVAFEQLLHTLKGLAVSAVMPPEQLPAAYFANLCLQTLRDLDLPLQESSRMAARPGQPDVQALRQARDKGWLTLWRLLALLLHDRMPPGVRPERIDRALGYALADLDQNRFRHLAHAPDEPPLPESAAVRFHHLAGRLAQLGWQHQPERAAASLRLLFAEAAGDYRLETTGPTPVPPAGSLLVNHLPPPPLGDITLIAPRACLAGWLLAAGPDTTPARLATGVTELPADCAPADIVAALADPQPLPAARRRERLAALRHPWPYRRFQLPGDTPAWLWDALHLGGLADPARSLQLTLPAGWTAAPGAGLLWQLLAERFTLAALRLYGDGRQTLTLLGHEQAPDNLAVCRADGTVHRFPLLLEDAEVAAVAALAEAGCTPRPVAPRDRKKRPDLPERIAREVFRDGLPRFPEHYLRRLDLPPLRTYLLPGPLQIDSHFFDRVLLTAPNGATVDGASPADAEALVLASRDGRPRVDLPTDPELTARLTAAYRADLRRLWQTLVEECRRHHPRQRHALALARRLWRERNLPAPEDG